MSKQKQFIVKVQVSLMTSHDVPQVLIYNESRKVWFQGPLGRDTQRAIGPAKKKYFNAHLAGTIVVLDEEVEEQDW